MADPDYFTLAEFRLLPDMGDSTKYPEDRVLAVAAYITAIIEREVGTSFVARTVTDEVANGGADVVILKSPFVLSVTSATEDGVTVTDDLQVYGGVIRRFTSGSYTPTYWSDGTSNILVTYEAGYSTEPPADIKEAAMQATRARLLETVSTSGIDDRRTSLSNEMGTVNFVIAGEGRPTGYPVVDEVVMGWKRKLNLPGIA